VVSHRDVRRSVEHKADGSFFSVLAEQHDRTREVRVDDGWCSDEESPCLQHAAMFARSTACRTRLRQRLAGELRSRPALRRIALVWML